MTSEIWAATGVAATVASVVLSFIVAFRTARKESRVRRKSEVEAHTLTNTKLDSISEGLENLSNRVNDIADDVAELKVTVAVHDDRFLRPSLRAVNETGA